MRRATMHDVAHHAGVSLKTVSRVINAERGVSPVLAGKVQAAVEQLGYRHNLAASNLRRNRQRTASFAVLVQDLSNPYSATLLRSVDDVARRHGVVMIAASLDEEEDRERDLVADLINRRVDGLILMPATHDQSYLQAEVEAGFVVVVIDRPPSNLYADSVLVDNVAGARMATRHLLEHGHRRIAIITDDQRIATAQQRLQGYQAALGQAGVTVDPHLVRSTRTVPGAVAVVHELLAMPDPPTAVFSARNAVTRGVVVGLREAGVAGSCAMVGFDDLPMADMLQPGVTVVEQQASQVGRQAAELLLNRLAGGLQAPPQEVVLPTYLIPRGSGELRPPAAARERD
ncbi:MAG TPA: LacI family DNA-binding transcriptional regulator [Propionibacteriaceae bacterium]|nr:LacI family DNA-binding transcriptional regulator [Propionibacteriaceae bacterium]